MNADNIKSQMRKGYLEYCILLILRKKPAYASDIISELKDAKLIVVEGGQYSIENELNSIFLHLVRKDLEKWLT
jgi:PadR family transcriptional regulator PadR